MISLRRVNISWVAVVAAFLILVAAGAVRLAFLSHPMRYDESFNYLNFVARGPAYIATHYLPNNHVLNTLCSWISIKVAGNSPAMLRLPALTAGLLLVPASGWLAWVVSRRLTVVFSVTLGVAASSALIEYSTNARGYSLLSLFVVLSAILFFLACERPKRLWRWIGWGGSGAIGFYAVPIMILPFSGMLAAGSVQLWRIRNSAKRHMLFRGMCLGTFLFAVLGAAAYAPILFRGGTKPFADSGDMAYRILGDQIGSAGELLTTMVVLWTRHIPILLVSFIACGIAVFLLVLIRRRDLARLGLLFIIVIPIGAAVVTRAPMPARTWIFALPFLWTAAATGFDDVLGWLRELRIGQLGAPVVQMVAGVGLAASYAAVAHAPSLCSEPGGLVLVEPALKACAAYGAERCALVAPYTPATDYYRLALHVSTHAGSEVSEVSRVYIVTNEVRTLDELWSATSPAYFQFNRPTPVWIRPDGSLYFADRIERNVLR